MLPPTASATPPLPLCRGSRRPRSSALRLAVLATRGRSPTARVGTCIGWPFSETSRWAALAVARPISDVPPRTTIRFPFRLALILCPIANASGRQFNFLPSGFSSIAHRRSERDASSTGANAVSGVGDFSNSAMDDRGRSD